MKGTILEKAIGIDLGNTNSAAAIDEGQVRILPTRMNESLMPSVVSFRRPRRVGQSGHILVGRAAVNNAVSAPDQTIFSVKRLMGQSVDDPRVVEVQARYPYAITEANDPGDRGVRVVLNDVKYTPVDISAMILRQLVEDARLALHTDVSHAVISVPAYFSEVQRAATRAAGDRAGLVVKRIIDEPTAAAIAFGVDPVEEHHLVLVYDLGGGTFDVSIIRVFNEQFEVWGILGDMWLGGDDFDHEIVAAIIEWVKVEYSFDPSHDWRFLMLARQLAERAKIALSGQSEVDLIIPAAAHKPDGESVDVDMVLSRGQFEKMIQPYVGHSLDLVRELLLRTDLMPDDITEVLMVGGSTAIPVVYQEVANLFGVEKVKRHVDPMLCVAMGAGILATRLTGIECPKCKTVNPEDARECKKCGGLLFSALPVESIGLGEVTAANLGISTVGQYGQPGALFDVIIPKGTPYPLKEPVERVFYSDSENLILVPVYESRNREADPVGLQGFVRYQLPEDMVPNSPVTLMFNYDMDRVLRVGIRVHKRPDLTREIFLTRQLPPEVIISRIALGSLSLSTITFLFEQAHFRVEELGPEEFLLIPQGEDHPQAHYGKMYTRLIAGRPPTGDDFTNVCEAVRQYYADADVDGDNDIDLAHRVALAVSDRRPESGARYRLYEIRQREGLAIAPLDIALFGQIKPDRTISDILAAEIDQATGQQNLYAISGPVSGDLSFFGRERVLQEIIDLLDTGQPVGLFGLRKVGKTSLIQRLQGRLAHRRPVAFVDTQSTVRQQGVWPFFPAIVAAFAAHLKHHRPNIALPNLHVWPEARSPSSAIAESFLQDLRALHEALSWPDEKERMLLIVDEVDRLFPAGRTEGYEGFAAFFGQLRAVNQQARILDFLVVGVDPSVNRRERWQDRDNELYRALREVWMPPMAPEDVREMIESLGSQMGVRYDADALQLLTCQGGGQPFVTRQMCSQVLEGRLGRGVVIVTADQARAAVDEFVFRDSYLAELWRIRLDDVQREMLSTLARSSDPVAQTLLLPAAQRREPLNALRGLEEYTLVRRDEGGYAIAWDVLRKWVRWVELGLEE